MYDEAMAAAVETAQRRLMSTAGKDSVLMTAAADLAELTRLTEKLDPSKIDFERGGLERLKAIGYWNRFEELYPSLKALFDKLVRSSKVLFNSTTTVRRFYGEYQEVYAKFCAALPEQQDEQYVQQAIVAKNMEVLLKNAVAEHEAVYEHLNRVTNILEKSLNIAVFLAKQKFDRSFGETGAAVKLLGSDATGFALKQQFLQLTQLLNEK